MLTNSINSFCLQTVDLVCRHPPF